MTVYGSEVDDVKFLCAYGSEICYNLGRKAFLTAKYLSERILISGAIHFLGTTERLLSHRAIKVLG